MKRYERLMKRGQSSKLHRELGNWQGLQEEEGKVKTAAIVMAQIQVGDRIDKEIE